MINKFITEPAELETIITIPLVRYDELLRKEFVYDLLKREAEESKYTDRRDKILFGIEKEKEDE